MNRLIHLDQAVTLWINRLGNPDLDSFWFFMSDSKIWFPAYGVVMALLIWRLGWKKGLVAVASLILCVVLTDQISAAIKEGMERLRPCYCSFMVDSGVRIPQQHWHLFAFFSGHASNTFGFATCSALAFSNDQTRSHKAYVAGVFVWAAITCLSRIMLAAHYAGDIIVGMLFGLMIGAAVAFAAKAVIKRI